mgnify:CR=1 FL=1
MTNLLFNTPSKKGQDLAINMDGEAVVALPLVSKKGGKHEKLIAEFNKALAQMKADGTLDEIIKKWTGESQSSSNSAVPETTTPAGQKATPKKSKYVISSDSSLHHLSSKMEKTNTQESIWT